MSPCFSTQEEDIDKTGSEVSGMDWTRICERRRRLQRETRAKTSEKRKEAG